MKLAGAPISWGVCEVPGWGYQLGADRVLSEMTGAGLTATELGPDGFLPADPAELAALLAGYHLAAVGAFAPVLLHDPDHDPAPDIEPLLDAFESSGGRVLVLAAATGTDGYDSRPVIDETGWRTLLTNLDRLAEVAASRGATAVLHPHVGTMVERRDEVQRVLDGARIPLCLDTGHLLIGGTDPAALANEYPNRIAHVHLKDVDAALAARVRDGELSYTDGVRAGMYRPLGAGDVGVAGIVRDLDAAGYDGWYVLEQDTILDGEPAGVGPLADVEASIEFLKSATVGAR